MKVYGWLMMGTVVTMIYGMALVRIIARMSGNESRCVEAAENVGVKRDSQSANDCTRFGGWIAVDFCDHYQNVMLPVSRTLV
jgi:hypothetical protein